MKINYMTWLRNRIGCANEEISLPPEVRTLADLLDFLEQRGGSYETALSERTVIYISKNNLICDHAQVVEDHDEISLFSPIVGG